MENTKQPKQKSAFFLLRAMVAFVLLFALIVGLYFWGYRSYRTVAQWADEEGGHSALTYEGETYTLVGVLGKKGLSLKKYPIDEVLGKVEDDGSVMTTEEVTFPPETEEGETLKVTPPNGDPTLARDHSYILYSVKDQEDYLLVLERDGEYYLYQLAEEETSGETEEEE